MDAEARTELLMRLGYLLSINDQVWIGSVTPHPEDLGVGERVLPMAMPTMQVMSLPWIKKVTLLHGSMRRSLGMTMSHGIKFEGGSFRYVLEGAAPLVVESLDATSMKMSKYYVDAAGNLGEVHRIARQIISKNSDHIWRTVSHLFPQYPDKLVAPEDWKGRMIESVMANRFPSVERFHHPKVTYSIFRTQDTIGFLGGARQRPFPGLVKDCTTLSRALQRHPEEMRERLTCRVPPLVKEYSSKGQYALVIKHLKRDLLRLRAYNPVPIEGYDLEGRLNSLEAAVNGIDFLMFKLRKEYRQSLINEVMETLRLVNGPWFKDRQDKYLELFGPTS
jgi:hypothetical protein